MRILALDTATENCSVALLIEGNSITREELLERGHAERILPMIDELLGESGATLGTLSAIAFGRGPGAFTGLRLAASVTQGLAFGADLPVVPVSDLQAVAQRLLDRDSAARWVLVCNDARMHEVYWGCFERTAAGFAMPLSAERVDRPERVKVPSNWSRAEARGAGRGFAVHATLATRLAGQLSSVSAELLPSALEIARLAVPEVLAGRVFPAEKALPVYLRDEVVHASTR
ncbi:MAG TPA: tRNA (adenosine(37)-N6)-threonylcarbamoyltransferase complex dimerization subunit type 1 TsaB [Steroidobacteraceae bacterium]|nr:tRNA (adenosine(37)-N6)-threonylcarbamoyltransferase complex dimerization subunit type 1 TsaB [Steroidobacteraceae bacterium]